LLNLLWIIVLTAYTIGGRQLVPFHGDESTLIYMTRDYDYQFIQHNLDLIRYSDHPVSLTEQALRFQNGTVYKYFVGLARQLRGFTIDQLNDQWDWGAGWDYNVQNGHVPSSALLLTARWGSTLLLAGGVTLIFAIGWIIGGRWVAYLASLYYALNPAILLDGRRAMMEGSLMFFSLLAILAGIWFMNIYQGDGGTQHGAPVSSRQRLSAPIALGLACGLAVASKHTALFVVGAIFAACGLWYVRSLVTRTRNDSPLQIVGYFTSLAAALAIVGLTFYVLNPAWWGGNPFQLAQYAWGLREETLNIQVTAWGGYPDFASRIVGFLRQTLTVTPQYYEVTAWANYPAMTDQIARYEASFWHGISIGGSLVGAVLLAALVGAGTWRLVRDKLMPTAALWVVGTWALVMILSISTLTPLEWQRYYLPVYPVVGLLAALGLVWVIRAGYERTIGNQTVHT
jgi:4-amino-4-deoxy-L-arabinose transferase-like glycosyltransferase